MNDSSENRLKGKGRHKLDRMRKMRGRNVRPEELRAGLRGEAVGAWGGRRRRRATEGWRG